MKRIVIVDDDPVVIRMGLESARYVVESASNGMESLELLRHQAPDLLITDIQMPQMDGKALCLEIDKQMPERQFPIVVLTSRTGVDHSEWTREIANMTFMEKPVSLRRLLAYADEVLNTIAYGVDH